MKPTPLVPKKSAKSVAGWPSEKIWLVLIPSAATVLLAAITLGGQYVTLKAAADARQAAASAEASADNAAGKAATAAVKVEEVRVELKDGNQKANTKLNEIDTQAKATHALVNSGSLVQLKINERSARRLASITKDPEDIKDMQAAEKMVRDHETKESTVNKK